MWTIFDKSGAFFALVTGSLYPADIPDGGSVFSGDFSSGYIMRGGEPVETPVVAYSIDKLLIIANGIDFATITVEAGAMATVHGQVIELTEPLEIDADMPGIITVTLSHPLRLDATVTIEAVRP